MSKNYTHLNSEQRYQIEALLKSGIAQKDIAKIVNKSTSTISRELKRNIPKRGRGALVYSAEKAQRKTDLRYQTKMKKVRFTDEMKEWTRHWMKSIKFSPELIHVVGKSELGDFVSHETIYKWIWHCIFKKENTTMNSDLHLEKLDIQNLSSGMYVFKYTNSIDSKVLPITINH